MNYNSFLNLKQGLEEIRKKEVLLGKKQRTNLQPGETIGFFLIIIRFFD
jgi:hypothetical protein